MSSIKHQSVHITDCFIFLSVEKVVNFMDQTECQDVPNIERSMGQLSELLKLYREGQVKLNSEVKRYVIKLFFCLRRLEIIREKYGVVPVSSI